MREINLPALRAQVRDFIDEQVNLGTFVPTIDCWVSAWNEQFTSALAKRGWVGMTIPQEYGGHGCSYLERYVVTEELLSAGAPVAAHWIADRQIGPSLLRYGTEKQKTEFLPRIARGEMFFAIGMSEPDSGTDLASVSSKAVRVEGGWKLNGTKIWTGGAHRAHAFIALVRTSDLTEQGRKHEGLSQFIVRLDAPGVSKEPIRWIDGTHHFNRVIFDEVFVPYGDVLGQIGQGWPQVLSELKFERSGPERFLSTMPALETLLSIGDPEKRIDNSRLGRHAARLVGLHSLSFEVARRLQNGESPELHASMVKVLGTNTESDIADDVAEWSTGAARLHTPLSDISDLALLRRAGFTLRGGSNEILRGIIAKGLGNPRPLEPELNQEITYMLDSRFRLARESSITSQLGTFALELWDQLRTDLQNDPNNRGQLETNKWADLFSLLHAAAKSGFALPLVEHDVLAVWLAHQIGMHLGEGIATIGWVLQDEIIEIPWGRHANTMLVVDPQQCTVTNYSRDDLQLDEHNDIAGIARDRVISIKTKRESLTITPEIVSELRLRGALGRSIQIVGTLAQSIDLAQEHVTTRHQFGQPLLAFQAVQALLADAAAEHSLARSAALRAIRVADSPAADIEALRRAIAIAKACAAEAVTVGVKNIHQVFGAIGTTQDHELHRYTLPALAWRADFGTGNDWSSEIGALVRREGLINSWRSMTQESHAQDNEAVKANNT